MTTPTVAVRSCVGCPSYLSAIGSVDTFGKSTAAPMCATYGTVLGKAGFTAKEDKGLTERIARDCPSFGKPKPDHPKVFAPLVTIPVENNNEPVDPELVRSCTQCSNFLMPDEVINRFGWAAGLCQLKGMLVLTHNTSVTAQACGERTMGTPHWMNPELNPIYTPEYYHVDLFKSYGAGVEHPLMYPTDKPVTEGETKDGILAWRKITDPQNVKRFTYLPIYTPDIFSETERAKIPQPGDDEHPELYLDYSNMVYKIAICWRELDETPMAWGAAGLGKTEVARHMAYLMQLPFERFSITASTELDDLAGKMMYEPDKGTYFQHGRMPLAWGKPGVMLIDEPNAGPPDVWQFLRPLTDNSKQLVLDTSAGERIDRHAHAYLMMAANPSWDPLNVGTNQIGDADASRLMHLKFNLPPEPLEKKIIAARVALDGWEIDNSQLSLIMKVADDVRSLCADGTLPMSWGIRVQIKVARALKWFSPIQAYKMATDDLEPQSQEAIIQSVKSNFPGEVEDEL